MLTRYLALLERNTTNQPTMADRAANVNPPAVADEPVLQAPPNEANGDPAAAVAPVVNQVVAVDPNAEQAGNRNLILYQRADDYTLPIEMELRSIPYTEADESLGIKFYTGPGWQTVFASDDHDGFRFNEEDNKYGMRLTTLTMIKAKEMMLSRPAANARGGTPPQTAAFKEVITEEINRLILQGSWKMYFNMSLN